MGRSFWKVTKSMSGTIMEPIPVFTLEMAKPGRSYYPILSVDEGNAKEIIKKLQEAIGTTGEDTDGN